MDKLLYYRKGSSTIQRWWIDRLCVEWKMMKRTADKTNIYHNIIVLG